VRLVAKVRDNPLKYDGYLPTSQTMIKTASQKNLKLIMTVFSCNP